MSKVWQQWRRQPIFSGCGAIPPNSSTSEVGSKHGGTQWGLRSTIILSLPVAIDMPKMITYVLLGFMPAILIPNNLYCLKLDRHKM